MSNAAARAMLAFGLVTAAGSATAQTFYHYECTDDASFEIVFYPETKAAYVQVDGKSMLLPKRFSLISQRFKMGGVSVALRGGGEAILKHAGKTSRCQVR